MTHDFVTDVEQRSKVMRVKPFPHHHFTYNEPVPCCHRPLQLWHVDTLSWCGPLPGEVTAGKLLGVPDMLAVKLLGAILWLQCSTTALGSVVLKVCQEQRFNLLHQQFSFPGKKMAESKDLAAGIELHIRPGSKHASRWMPLDFLITIHSLQAKALTSIIQIRIQALHWTGWSTLLADFGPRTPGEGLQGRLVVCIFLLTWAHPSIADPTHNNLLRISSKIPFTKRFLYKICEKAQ